MFKQFYTSITNVFYQMAKCVYCFYYKRKGIGALCKKSILFITIFFDVTVRLRLYCRLSHVCPCRLFSSLPSSLFPTDLHHTLSNKHFCFWCDTQDKAILGHHLLHTCKGSWVIDSTPIRD